MAKSFIPEIPATPILTKAEAKQAWRMAGFGQYRELKKLLEQASPEKLLLYLAMRDSGDQLLLQRLLHRREGETLVQTSERRILILFIRENAPKLASIENNLRHLQPPQNMRKPSVLRFRP